MAIKLGQWKAEWDRMKKKFESETDRKKPSKTFLGKRLKSGVSSAFGKMDDGYNNFSKAKIPDRPKLVKAFAKTVATAAKEVESYCKILDSAASKETDGSDIQKLIKIMKKDAKACLAQAQGQVAQMSAIKDDGTYDPKLMRTAKVLKATLHGTLKKSSLWIAQRARDKDVEIFNNDINGITRDVTQNLANLLKVYKDTPAELKELRMCNIPLVAWADKGRKLDKDADEAALIKELKLVQASIKRTSAWLKTSGDPT
jgi:hypothetical protein